MKYIYHRGITSKKCEENSYLAIKRALLNNNSQGVEFDIRLTKDNKIILSHDNIIGFDIIENMDYNDIIKEKYLTTLDKILSINSNKIFLIDIKTNNNYKKFADVLLNELKDINKNIYLASFDKKIINYLKKKSKYKKSVISFKFNNNYDFIMVNYKTISVDKIKKTRKEVFLWTIKNIKSFTDKFGNDSDYFIIIDKEE